tara:strand:- start:259 stop:1206 length:948 start_codon:yes stop_codon:yes gene_type:complete
MKITVCIRTYKRPQFLKEALASISLQTHKDWEVIIFDDAGSEENFDIYSKFKQAHSNSITYITKATPKSLYRNSWHMGVNLANGEVIVRLDDDDLLAENTLEFISRVYEENSRLDFTYGESIKFEGNTLMSFMNTKFPWEHTTKNAWAPYTNPEGWPWVDPWMWYVNFYKEEKPMTSITHASRKNCFCVYHLLTMRVSSVDKVKHLFNVTSYLCDDLEVVASLEYLGLHYSCIKKPLCFIRKHKEGNLTQQDNWGNFREDIERVRNKVDRLRLPNFKSSNSFIVDKDNIKQELETYQPKFKELCNKISRHINVIW